MEIFTTNHTNYLLIVDCYSDFWEPDDLSRHHRSNHHTDQGNFLNIQNWGNDPQTMYRDFAQFTYENDCGKYHITNEPWSVKGN